MADTTCIEVNNNIQESILSWKDCGQDAFEAAVKFYVSIAEEANEPEIRKWVWDNVPPTNTFRRIR